MANVEMVIDSIRVNVDNNQRAVVLKEKIAERYLPIWMGPAEGDAIAVTLQGVSIPRPLTHDFVCAVIRALRASVQHVIISDLKNDNFYAKTLLKRDKEILEIDCRPSDALAVAVRFGIPIFADDKVLKKVGITLDSETGKSVEQSSAAVPVSKTGVEPSRLEIFSESTQDILERAESEAKSLNHSSISTGHLLLALLKEVNVATEILKNIGIDLIKIQADVEASLAVQPNIEGNEPGLTTAVKKVIQLSVEEARLLGNERVKPEHLLIGLVRQNDGIAAALLRNLMINPERIYIELIRLYTRP